MEKIDEKKSIPTRRGLQMLLQEVEANAKTFESTQVNENTEKRNRSGSPLPWENR